MLLSRLLARPSPITACLGVVAAVVVLYQETPPPFWSERCVAWKDAGRDSCKKCCSAYGANYWTPRAVAAACLAVLFLRRGVSACLCSSPPAEDGTTQHTSGWLVVFIGRATCMAALSVPALLYTPNEYRPVWTAAPLAGLALSAVGHLAGCHRCCCGGGGSGGGGGGGGGSAANLGAGRGRRVRKDAWLELACWGGASLLSTCARGRRFDLDDVGDAVAEAWRPQMQRALGMLVCGLVAVVFLLEGRICGSRDSDEHSKRD